MRLSSSKHRSKLASPWLCGTTEVKIRSVKKTASASRTGVRAVRAKVRDLLERSPSFRSLPPDQRRQVAHDTVRVASYLVDPERLVSQEFASPVLRPSDLLDAVDFPAFVSGLINGVFGAIVNASIQQMEAYAKLVALAASSVSDFMADKITADMARVELLNQFPQMLCISQRGSLQFEGRADRSTMTRLAQSLELRRPWPTAESANAMRVLVTAARRRVARERQKSLALALSMGINRIVVTGGRISARP